MTMPVEKPSTSLFFKRLVPTSNGSILNTGRSSTNVAETSCESNQNFFTKDQSGHVILIPVLVGFSYLE
jgi:hypothetical protein